MDRTADEYHIWGCAAGNSSPNRCAWIVEKTGFIDKSVKNKKGVEKRNKQTFYPQTFQQVVEAIKTVYPQLSTGNRSLSTDS